MFPYTTAFVLLTVAVTYITATELTFELPDNAKECFHEMIDRNIDVSLEYQVGFIH